MSVPALSKMAQRACIKNIRSITDVGDAEYDVVRPVLMRIENPDQLDQIEQASPQIKGHDVEIWLELIKRDVADWDKRLGELQHRQKWHKVRNWYKKYNKLVRDSQDEIRKDAELLKAQIDGINNERSKHKLKQVELDIVRLPEDIKRSGPTIKLDHKVRFIDRGTQHGKAPSQKQLKIERGELDPNAPRRVAAPKGIMGKIRTEAKANTLFQHQPTRPTGTITAREMAVKQKPTNATISKAPQSMIEEYRRASTAKPIDPSAQVNPIFNPRKRKIEHDGDRRTVASTNEPREQQPKTLSTPSALPKSAPMIKPPRSRPMTPAASPPVPSPLKPDRSQSTKDKPSFANSQLPTTASWSSPLKPVASTAPGTKVSQSGISSPSNGHAQPPTKMKRKAPVDIFMKPTKRSRPA